MPSTAGAVADIGAGHGALSACLRLHVDRVIATEVADGPYNELCRNLSRWGANDVDVRRGHGLDPLQPGEVDVVVVAGMGAHTMLAISESAPQKSLHTLILQCMQRSELVEPWLAARAWRVIARADVADGGRVYPSWLVRASP